MTDDSQTLLQRGFRYYRIPGKSVGFWGRPAAVREQHPDAVDMTMCQVDQYVRYVEVRQ